MRYTQLLERSCMALFIAGIAFGIPLGAWLWPKERVVVREGTPDNPAAISSVHLMINYGDGNIRTWNTITHHEAMSVMNLLETVHAAGNITLTTTIGANGLPEIAAIDGVANDPSSGLRWQYWVNNVIPHRSVTKYYLKPGDIVVVARGRDTTQD